MVLASAALWPLRKKGVEDRTAGPIERGLQVIQILMQASDDDLVHLRVVQLRREASQRPFGGIAEAARRGAADNTQAAVSLHDTVTHGTRKVLIQQQEADDFCGRQLPIALAIHLVGAG